MADSRRTDSDNGGRGAGERSADDRAPRLRERSSRFGLPGSIYLLTTAFLAIGAVNSQNNLLFFAFGLAVSGLLVSGFVSGSAMMGVRVERLAPEAAEADEPTKLRYRVSNRNRFMPAFALTIRERPSPGARDGLGLERAHAFADRVAAGGTVVVEARVVPTARGSAELDWIEVSSTFPFGIVRKVIRRSVPERVLVLPARVRLASAAMDRLFGLAERDAAASRRRGVSSELWGLREYVPGDPARSVAWRPSARMDQLVVRQTAEPNAARVRITLDLTGDVAGRENDRSPAERAIALSAAIGRRMARRGVPTQLWIVGDTGAPPGWSTRTFARDLERLAMLEPEALLRGDEPPPARSDAFEMVVRTGGGGVRERRDGVEVGADGLESLLAAGGALPRSLLAHPGESPRGNGRGGPA